MKILILGDQGLVVRNEFKSEGPVPTIGIDFIRQGDHQLWWHAGELQFRNIAKGMLRGADAVVVVVRMDNEESFSIAKNWVKSIEENSPECKIVVMCLHPEDKNREIVFKSDVDAWVKTFEGKVDVIDQQVSQYETKPDKHPIVEWADKNAIAEEKEIVQPPEPKKSRIAMPQISLPRISLFGQSKQEEKIEQGLNIVKLVEAIQSEADRVSKKLDGFAKQINEAKEPSEALLNNLKHTSEKLAVLNALMRALKIQLQSKNTIDPDELKRICCEIPNFSAINVFDEGTRKHVSGKTTLYRNLEKALGAHKGIVSVAIKNSELRENIQKELDANKDIFGNVIKSSELRENIQKELDAQKKAKPKVYQYGATDDAEVVPSAPIERVSEDKHFVGEVEPSAPPVEVSAQPINYVGDGVYEVPPAVEAPHLEQEVAPPEYEPPPPAYGADADVADKQKEIADFPEVPKYTPKFYKDEENEEAQDQGEEEKNKNKPILG